MAIHPSSGNALVCGWLQRLVTNLIEAEVLVILTDQAGLYNKDPRTNPDATLLQEAEAGDE